MSIHASIAKLAGAGVAALGLALVPATLSPEGGLQPKEACAAEEDCEFEPGSECFDAETGTTLRDYRRIIIID